MKRVELRTHFARWFSFFARQAEKEIKVIEKQLTMLKSSDFERIKELQVKIAEFQKIADYNREEERRYCLQARVCGNEVLTIK